jgi:hypothetical protein
MAFLYINAKGTPWAKHSYSAGMDFDACPYRYYLRRVLGWKEINNRARFELGKALEDAIQWHHEHNGEGAEEHFIEKWTQHKENKKLLYTKVEKDWDRCLRIGIDWVRLYKVRQPELPIPVGGMTVFQREFSKEVFPEDPNFGGIEDAGRIDIYAYVDPEHPALPRVSWKPEYGAFRPVIGDIKTSGVDGPENPGIAGHDVQLRRYSWLTGVRTVFLLYFVKKSPSIEKGSSVTLLEDARNFKAGKEAVVAMTNDDETVWLVANDFLVEEMTRAQGLKADKNGTKKPDQTAEGKARREAWLQQYGSRVPLCSITKQRLQFCAGYVSPDSAKDAGRIAQSQIVRIVNAWKNNSWPNTFGIRYPHDDRSDPYFRAFVLKDESYKKQNFEQSDSDGLDDLFNEETNEEE